MSLPLKKESAMQDVKPNTAEKKLLGMIQPNQRGAFGLPELALVLLIGALIAGASILILPGIFSGFRAGKITDEFNIAIPAIQTAYQNQTSYSGLTTAQVAQNQWVSSGFIEYSGGVPTGNLITAWGTLTFVPIAGGTQAQGTLTNVPTRECIKIANTFTNDQYLTAAINGATVKTSVNNVDLTAVGTQCSSTTTNTVVFTFGRA